MKTQSYAAAQRGLSPVLEHAAEAMRDLGMKVSLVEASLLDSLYNASGENLTWSGMQQVDLIAQSVEELALLFDRIASRLPTEMEVSYDEVIAPIRLQRLREQIAGCDMGESEGTATAPSGRVMLF